MGFLGAHGVFCLMVSSDRVLERQDGFIKASFYPSVWWFSSFFGAYELSPRFNRLEDSVHGVDEELGALPRLGGPHSMLCSTLGFAVSDMNIFDEACEHHA